MEQYSSQRLRSVCDGALDEEATRHPPLSDSRPSSVLHAASRAGGGAAEAQGGGNEQLWVHGCSLSHVLHDGGNYERGSWVKEEEEIEKEEQWSDDDALYEEYKTVNVDFGWLLLLIERG